jgi:peptidoglycan/LPS O-acetylase OafA/YrhL
MRAALYCKGLLLSNRFSSLDGLRGTAALIVVIFHFMSAFTPAVVPDQSPSPPWWSDSPLAVLYNGTFAVPVFFVLSGFVLTHSTMHAKSSLPLDMVFRYFRLAVPATISVLMAWALLSLFPSTTTELKALIPGPWLRYTHQDHIPSIFNAVKDGAYSSFVTGSSRFNNVLWTMQTELIGSFCIYTYFRCIKFYQAQILVLSLMAMVLMQVETGYISFGLGAALYLLHRSGFSIDSKLAIWLFMSGLIIGSWSTGFAQRIGLPLLHVMIEPGHKQSLWYPIAALLVVTGTLYSPPSKQFFHRDPRAFWASFPFPSTCYMSHLYIPRSHASHWILA